MNRAKSIFTNIVLVSSALAIAALAAEQFLRIGKLTRDVDKARFVSHPAYKFHYLPDQQFTTLHGATVTINHYGFRDSGSYDLDRKSGKYRILIIGDSVGFGMNVSDELIFTNGLAEELSEIIGAEVEIVNASCQSYNTHNELAWYNSIGSRLNADEVWLFYVSNDIAESASDFYVSPDGYSTSNPSSVIPLRWRVSMRTSALFMLLNQGLSELSRQRSPAQDPDIVRTRIMNSELALATLLQEINSRSRLRIMSLPRRPEVEERQSSAGAQLLTRVAQRHGYPVTDLAPALSSVRANGKDPFLPYDAVHLSPAGHEALRDVLIDMASRNTSNSGPR